MGSPHMPNMVKIGLGVWAGPIPSLSPHLGYRLFFLYSSLAVPMRPLDRSSYDAVSAKEVPFVGLDDEK